MGAGPEILTGAAHTQPQPHHQTHTHTHTHTHSGAGTHPLGGAGAETHTTPGPHTRTPHTVAGTHNLANGTPTHTGPMPMAETHGANGITGTTHTTHSVVTGRGRGAMTGRGAMDGGGTDAPPPSHTTQSHEETPVNPHSLASPKTARISTTRAVAQANAKLVESGQPPIVQDLPDLSKFKTVHRVWEVHVLWPMHVRTMLCHFIHVPSRT